MKGNFKSSELILIIEDHEDLAKSVADLLQFNGYRCEVAFNAEKALDLLDKHKFDAVLTDVQLPGMTGIELLTHLHSLHPYLPVILTTGIGTSELAIEAMKRGAFDYLVKPVDPEILLTTLKRAISCYNTTKTSEDRAVEIQSHPGVLESIVGRSTSMQSVYKEIGRVADLPITVLILGATGTGKELVARALHDFSNRKNYPFVAINCAAIPEGLLESELFGHERGAFTGAVTKRLGCFEQAQGGTLFLDEIGELSLPTQAKLLRVLQEKRIQRIGGWESVPVDVRIVVATHRDIETYVAHEKFRQDLFFRINGVIIRLPSLNQRKEDIPHLVEHFIKLHSREWGMQPVEIRPDAMKVLVARDYPGNVRELENIIRKALVLARGYQITPEILEQALGTSPRSINETNDRGFSQTINNPNSLENYLDQLVQDVDLESIDNLHERFIERCEKLLFSKIFSIIGNNKSAAARTLGLSRVTLREKLRKFGMENSLKE